MQKLICENCKAHFYFDEEMEECYIDNKPYCSHCFPKIKKCSMCGEIKIMKTSQSYSTYGEVVLCKDCLKTTTGFPNLWLMLRFKTFQRDNFTCRYCGRSPLQDKNVELHCDHIIPRNKDGKNELDNLVTACNECNAGKLDILLTEYQQNLIKNRKIYNDYVKSFVAYRIAPNLRLFLKSVAKPIPFFKILQRPIIYPTQTKRVRINRTNLKFSFSKNQDLLSRLAFLSLRSPQDIAKITVLIIIFVYFLGVWVGFVFGDTGTASWYDIESCLREGTSGICANGQRLDDTKLTCASWDYPFGARLKITNLNNYKSVIVTVTDRGPSKKLYRKGRIIDLSKAAFSSIASLRQGIIPIKAEVADGN